MSNHDEHEAELPNSMQSQSYAMAEKSPFHYKFRLNGYSPQVSRPAKVTKRHRVPLSCAPCRVRKLRCNRTQPCEHCVKREDAASCLYVTTADLHTPMGAGGSNKSQHTEERLHCLERLVAEAIELHQGELQRPKSHKSLSNLLSRAPSEGLLTKISTSEEDHFTTVGPTTWTNILGNIQDVIADLDVNADNVSIGDDDTNQRTASDTDNISIFSVGRPPNLEIVLSELPPRQEVDRCLSKYFNVKYVVLPTIHIHSFQRMYEAFWKNPHQVPIFWIAQLFAILSVSAVLSELRGSEPKHPNGCLPAKHQFLKATAQCLNLGDFTQPHKYVIESLLLYTQCKYMSSPEPAGELWMLFGLILRQALRMGYHRDPDHLQNITVFEGEMRRRCWAVLRQLDLLNSYQMGLPSSTQSLNSDTALPRNLQDSDFDEASTTLPAARPETEATHMLYFLVKARLMAAFEEILEYESSFKIPSDQKIAALDAQLRQIHKTVPLPFKLKSMAQSFADTPHVIMMRANIETLFQKSICILHRRNLTVRLPSVQTIDICAEASIRMLEVQVGLHQEAQPGGQLHEDRWMLSSLNMTDFFLAAMILSLVLLKERARGLDQNAERGIEQKLDLLNKSFLIFDAQKLFSNQACKINLGLRAMSSKLKAVYDFATPSITPSNESASVAVPSFMAVPRLHQDASVSGEQTADTFDDAVKAHDYFDWDVFDQYRFDLDAYAPNNLYQTAYP